MNWSNVLMCLFVCLFVCLSKKFWRDFGDILGRVRRGLSTKWLDFGAPINHLRDINNNNNNNKKTTIYKAP